MLSIQLFIFRISLVSIAVQIEAGGAGELDLDTTTLLAILTLETRTRLLEFRDELFLPLLVGLVPVAYRCRPIKCCLLALYADQSLTGIEKGFVILLDPILFIAAC